jgi:Family of unknown function (DUF6491)
MKKMILVALLSMGVAGSSQAANETDHAASPEMRVVDHFWTVGGMDDWRPLGRDSLIVWATPFRPYLIKLSRPSFDLRFEQTIGVTSMDGTVYAKFDSVIVDGIRYPILAIYELDPKAARHMKETA